MAPKAILKREGAIGIIEIDNPPVNALSPEVVGDLELAFSDFEADPALAGLVVSCTGRTFVAGGDIAVFDDPSFTPRRLNGLLARIEASERPVAAALFGTVLGGGLELAMACHIRVASPGTRLGMPEITLGILPGSLGTQRLPRLAGYDVAYRMISSGQPVTAAQALADGIVDAVDDDPSRRAAAMAAGPATPALRRASVLAAGGDRAAVLAEAGRAAAEKPHLPALAELVACLAAVERPFAEGAAVEEAAFLRLLRTAPSRSLRHVFFAERAAARIPGLPADIALRPVSRVGVVGVGTMGGGIAMTFANAGFEVTLVETSAEGLARGIAIIEKNYAATVSKGRLSAEEAARRRRRMTGTTDLTALADADLVVEAVFEDLDLKLDVAGRLGGILKPGAILATNTSTLDVDAIAEASGRPGDVLGTHFFSPAHVMRLLEVVRGAATAPDVLATVMSLAKRIDKTAVVSGVCYGFIGNRMAEVYMRESEAMQLEGAAPADIDGVAESPEWIGMAMGPSRMLDMAGVDVGARTVIEWIKSGAGPQDPAYRILCRTMFAEGRHGQKTGQGYYRYAGRNALPNPDLAVLAQRLAGEHGIRRRATIPPQEIFERLLLPMINEAARILEEGIAYRPGDVDVVWTAGYGFPSWRGGPLFMADEIGLSRIVERLDHHAVATGNRHGYWTVAPLLRKLAAEGRRISDWRP